MSSQGTILKFSSSIVSSVAGGLLLLGGFESSCEAGAGEVNIASDEGAGEMVLVTEIVGQGKIAIFAVKGGWMYLGTR